MILAMFLGFISLALSLTSAYLSIFGSMALAAKVALASLAFMVAAIGVLY